MTSLTGKPLLWLLLSVLSAGSMTFYVNRIWGANQPAHFNDFYARWWGAHELLLHGRDPYSPAVTHEIQSVIYGAPVASGSPQDPSGIGGGFAYPPYVALLLWPTVYLSFPTAQKVFLISSVLATLLSFAIWMRLLRFRGPPLIWLALAVFTFGSFPALQAIKLQNPSMLAASFIAITFFLLASDRLVLAGILLAASTFKPQFTIALVPWLALWAMGDWRRRRSMAVSFLITMLLLVGISEWMVPGWIPRFLHVIHAYRDYAYGHSVLDVWFGPTWGSVLAACFLLAILLLSWRYRAQPADSERFLVVNSMLLAATVIVIPTMAPHAQLLLLPGVFCMIRSRALLRAGALSRLVLVGAWILLAWPWVAAFGLFLTSARLQPAGLLRFWEIPLYGSPVLPLVIFAALGCLLYAVPSAGNQDSIVPISGSWSASRP